MIIELKGVEFENKGAELMMYAVIERIRQYWPNAEIVLSPSAKAPFFKRSSLNAWQKLSIRKLYFDFNSLSYYLPKSFRNWLKGWGIVTEVDIDMVIDASGFSYSDQWDPSMSIRHLAAEINRNARNKKPYIFMPQAFGPFSTYGVRSNIEKSFKNAALINARESDSYNHLKNIIGDLPNLQIFGDFTNAIEGYTPDYFKHGETKACIVPNKNMINPRNKNKSWISTYEQMIIEAIAVYQEKSLTPFFLNHEGKEDLELINRINDSLPIPLDIITENDPMAVKGIIAASKTVLCSRFHGCVSALSNGIPCIGTSWSHKYERLYDGYKASELLLSPSVTKEEIAIVIENSLATESDLFLDIQAQAKLFKNETEKMWQSIVKASKKYQ